jgi:hypothetical protein
VVGSQKFTDFKKIRTLVDLVRARFFARNSTNIHNRSKDGFLRCPPFFCCAKNGLVLVEIRVRERASVAFFRRASGAPSQTFTKASPGATLAAGRLFLAHAGSLGNKLQQRKGPTRESFKVSWWGGAKRPGASRHASCSTTSRSKKTSPAAPWLMRTR